MSKSILILNFVAADFERDYRINNEECQRISFKRFNLDLRLRGRLRCGGLQCGIWNAIASHALSSNA